MTKHCFSCGAEIDARAEICPKCGVRQHAPPATTNPALQKAASDKLTAGLCGILLGGFGVHKFVLGMTTPALIMLLVTVCTCGLGGLVMHTIGLIEGIIYLTRTDEDFHEIYVVGKKEWF